jgi:parvulin-like peptidyl-prolyl isomerase
MKRTVFAMMVGFAVGETIGQAQTPSPLGNNEATTVATVVARVDHRAILLGDAIDRVRPQLELMRKQLSADEYRRQERAILKQQTDELIDRAVILEEVSAKIKDAERLKEIRRRIGLEFEKNLLKFAKAQGLKSKEQVIDQFEKEGTSLEKQRSEFIDKILADEYLRQQITGLLSEPSRDDLHAYYKAHLDQFQQNAGVVWRHIEIRIGSDPKQAAEKTHQVMQQLAAGADFSELARRFSDDASASAGGLCPMTSKGSFYEDAVDRALFSLPVGQVSQPIRGRHSFHIVRVEKRTTDGAKPFSEVQTEILKTLKDRQFVELRQKKLREMRQRHYIESIFERKEIAEPDTQKAIR